MERGAIGKGRRALSRWLNKDELDRKAIETARAMSPNPKEY